MDKKEEREKEIKRQEGRMKRVTCQEMRRIPPVGHYMRGLCFTRNEGEGDRDGEREEEDGMKRGCYMYVCATRVHTHIRTITEKQLHRERRVHTRKKRGREGDPRWHKREEPAAKG